MGEIFLWLSPGLARWETTIQTGEEQRGNDRKVTLGLAVGSQEGK